MRDLFMSVDPYMRGRTNERRSYIPAFETGKPLAATKQNPKLKAALAKVERLSRPALAHLAKQAENTG